MKADAVRFVRWFESVTSADVSIVGGKNASLGEMIGTLQKEGVREHLAEAYP
jgi:pyruvate,water dikinase